LPAAAAAARELDAAGAAVLRQLDAARQLAPL
jgi:hypothetical protein